MVKTEQSCAHSALRRKAVTMDTPWKPLLFWTPRVLTVLFALFLSLFALDVFNEGYGFWTTILALLIHLIPTWIVLAVLVVSWRWGLVGFVAYTALGAYYIVTVWGRMHWSVYPVIAGPLFLLGALFLVDWLYQVRLAPR
jgi:hypothetical protein